MAVKRVLRTGRQGLSNTGQARVTTPHTAKAEHSHAARTLQPPHSLRRAGYISSSPAELSRDTGNQYAPRGGAAGPLNIYAPSKSEVSTSSTASTGDVLEDVTSIAVDTQGRKLSPSVSVSRIMAPVQVDMEQLSANLKSVVGNRHPMLTAAAAQIFGAGGKKMRPAIVFLVARATCKTVGLSDITERHRRLAEITEMIHTASLVHDDVLDDCATRRGKSTVNSIYGSKIAVLAGDFLFAQSSWFLANLDNLEVIKLISQVIADFADGEIAQAASLFDCATTLQQYLDKSFYKTASLIAASCRSAAVFSSDSALLKDAMFEYGRHLGLAFQIVDDVLDFTQTSEQLGKPQGQDLATGNLTAPVLFALETQYGPQLRELIDTEFTEPGDLQHAIQLVKSAGGISAARELARKEADMALAALEVLADSPAKQSLEMMVDYVLDRLY